VTMPSDRRRLFPLNRVMTWLMAALLSLAPCGAQALADPLTTRQQLESAYVYNFLLFAHWPQEEQVLDSAVMTICIVGDDSFAELFAPVAGKAIKGTRYTLAIRMVRAPINPLELTGCVLLYLGEGARHYLPDILAQTKALPILTVSNQPDFAAAGGMIGLVERNGKLRWQINQDAASEAGMRLDAQLLRNAEAVIGGGQEDR